MIWIFENKIIDFSNDSLILGKFVFHLPISQFAFDYYDYELLGIKQNKSRTFYQIKVIPYSKIRPTFSGELLIDDSSYALAGLNLTLENRNFIPYTNVKLSVIQNIEKLIIIGCLYFIVQQWKLISIIIICSFLIVQLHLL